MSIIEVRKAAREKLAGICSLCPVCNGKACAGKVPGIGGVGTGTSFQNNVEALAKIRLNLRTLHDVTEPKVKFDFLGKKLSAPIIGGAVAGAAINFQGRLTEQELAEAFVKGCEKAGTLAMTGDGPDLSLYPIGLEAILACNGKGIPIIKPREQQEIITRIKQAEESGAVAVGIDIDAAGLINMTQKGQKVEPKSLAKLKELVEATALPIILKGIMTVDEALIAVEAGVKAIVVSNHGGRALDWLPGTAEVLPTISQAVKGKISVLVDGGIRTGADVLKCLALGADAVVIGRPLAVGVLGGQDQGVKLVIEQLIQELRTAMILTGSPDVKEVSLKILA